MTFTRLLVPVLLFVIAPCTAAQVIVDSTSGRTITIKVVNPPPPPADTPLVREVRPGHPLLIELTRKSRRVVQDTIWLYSNIDAQNWPYHGEALDRSLESLFAPFYPGLTFPHEEPQLFASARFVLDPQHVAYVLRVPGMYESTALDLFVYDSRTMRFSPPERLAESWGDEGCGFALEALLIRSATNRQVSWLTHKNTGCSDIETGKVLSNSDSVWIRPWSGATFAAPEVSADSALLGLFSRQWRRLRP